MSKLWFGQFINFRVTADSVPHRWFWQGLGWGRIFVWQFYKKKVKNLLDTRCPDRFWPQLCRVGIPHTLNILFDPICTALHVRSRGVRLVESLSLLTQKKSPQKKTLTLRGFKCPAVRQMCKPPNHRSTTKVVSAMWRDDCWNHKHHKGIWPLPITILKQNCCRTSILPSDWSEYFAVV